MKFPRTVIVALTGLWSACLAACSPSPAADAPLADPTLSITVPSALRPSPTPTIGGEAIPEFIDCVSVPVAQPEVISLNCINNSDVIRSLTWTEWTGDRAIGHGQRYEGKKKPKVVKVELRGPINSTQGLVFTEIVVDGKSYFQ